MKLLLATENIHKIHEFRTLLKPLKKLDIYSLADFPGLKLPPEEGATFEENSRIKALHAAKETSMMALGDDSGLVVPALGGDPGLFSSRYAGLGASDKENRLKLLAEMSAFTDQQRVAFFICVLTLATSEGVLKTFQAQVEGVITPAEKGGQGFGYDSLFLKEGYSQTFGELTEDTKHKISHRGRAVEKLILFLDRTMTSQ